MDTKEGKRNYLDVKQVASYLGVSVGMISRLIKENPYFPARRLGRLWRFKPDDIDRWLLEETNTKRGK